MISSVLLGFYVTMESKAFAPEWENITCLELQMKKKKKKRFLNVPKRWVISKNKNIQLKCIFYFCLDLRRRPAEWVLLIVMKNKITYKNKALGFGLI